jgi:hypothetical protein
MQYFIKHINLTNDEKEKAHTLHSHGVSENIRRDKYYKHLNP